MDVLRDLLCTSRFAEFCGQNCGQADLRAHTAELFGAELQHFLRKNTIAPNIFMFGAWWGKVDSNWKNTVYYNYLSPNNTISLF